MNAPPTPNAAAIRPVRVLVVEDNPGDARLLRAMLKSGTATPFAIEHVDCLGAALEKLRLDGLDILLLDLSLPDSHGIETFEKVYATAPHVPILILTGLDDENTAVRAVNQGAQDFLVKGKFDGPALVRAMRHSLERKRILEALRENEQRYKLLIESTSDYIYTATVRDGSVVSTVHSTGCEGVTGYRPADYERDPGLWLRMVLDDDKPAVVADAAAAIAGRPTTPIEHRLLHKDGRPRWVKHTSVARRNERGEVVSVFGIISDITDRRAAEERLRISEALYSSLVESLPQNIFRKDLKGRFTFANTRFCTELGKTRDEIMGKTDADFFPAELASRYRGDDERVIASRQIFENIEEHVTGEGRKIYVQVVKIPLFDSTRRVVGIQGIFWDITKQKVAEQELREAAAALRAANEELRTAQMQLIQAEKMLSISGLAAGVAHEVKNPLAVIGLGIEFLGRQPFATGKDIAPLLKDMIDAIERADAVIGGLLDFSRQRDLDLQDTSLTEVIERSLRLVQHEVLARNVNVERNLAPDIPPVRIDRRKIEQVFVNLFTNAMHAMPKFGTLAVRTYAKSVAADEADLNPGIRGWDRLRVGDPVAVVEIDDTGSGIPEANLLRIFDPFFTTKSTGVGLGLGLSVVSKIIELHDGMISIRNRPRGQRARKAFLSRQAGVVFPDEPQNQNPARR
jgi:PAS domain S-box-containing protein